MQTVIITGNITLNLYKQAIYKPGFTVVSYLSTNNLRAVSKLTYPAHLAGLLRSHGYEVNRYHTSSSRIVASVPCYV